MAVGLLMAAIVVSAHAVTAYYYCGYNTGPLLQCQQGATRHSWNQNTATGTADNGSRYANKCERMNDWDVHSVIYSRRCGTGIQQTGRWAGYCNCPLSQIPNPGNLLQSVVGNNEQYHYQTMYGVADYDT